MADFEQNSEIKSAVRLLANPIADVSSFDTIIASVITDNPFECVAYMTAGVTHDPVEKTKETYTARIVYEDVDAKTAGTSTEKYNTIAGLNAGVAVIMANAPLATAHGGTAIHDPDEDSYSATLKCHDANGELYFVNFSRNRLTVTSYSADAILTKVETWADTIAGLA
ncbi:MAG: hypothetical protein NTV84_00070 [Methanoregula sp.]|nr:hypothetical protein [Methanoregula sp.]